MNSTSWFLYAVDLMSGLEGFFIAAVLGYIGWLIFLWVGALIYNDVNQYDIRDKTKEKRELPKATRSNFVVIAVLSFVIAVLPSTKTMYLIMASELTASALTSETGKRVQDAINKQLDKYLSSDK